MILTVPGPATLAEYVKLQRKDRVQRPQRCSGCLGRRIWRHTGYKRIVREIDGAAQRIEIERFRCALCGVVFSCLFEFLIPYVQYTMQAVAAWAEAYLENRTTYEALGWSGPGDRKATVFRRINGFVRKSEELLAEVQTEAILADPEHVSMERPGAECPKSEKAMTSHKSAFLNSDH